jgi:hypothetical protein
MAASSPRQETELLVVNVDRISGTRTPTRTRLHAITAAAALAVVGVFALPASLSAPSQPVTASPASISAPPAPNPAPPAAPAADPVAPAAPAPVPSAPTAQELHPVAISGTQQTFTPTAEQMSNAKAIVDAGKAMGLPPRAWTIAVSTALQESNLHNIGDLGASNDHDSLGLFQQRPSSGWGSPADVTNPTYAATAFYKGLVEVSGWQSMPLTQAAQKVQVSAYPDHYAKHEAQAGDMITALYGAGPHAGIAATIS